MIDFDTLMSQAKEIAKAKKVKKKTVKKAKVKLKDKPKRTLLPVSSPWTDEAVVLFTTIEVCKTCHSEYRSTATNLFIQRTRTRKGGTADQHFQQIKAFEYKNIYSNLPTRKREEKVTINSCPRCFCEGEDKKQGEINTCQLSLI